MYLKVYDGKKMIILKYKIKFVYIHLYKAYISS